MHSLPILTDPQSFRAWRADASRWLTVAADIAHSHGLSCETPHVFATGTNLVVGLDDRLILKIFPPMLRAQFLSERASLTQLQGRLRVPIPEIVAEGVRDQWPYLVITRLPGRLGAEVWPTLPEEQKERVLAQLGATIAEVQAAPVAA
jgi:hygromycin-B 7''-O-kinase